MCLHQVWTRQPTGFETQRRHHQIIQNKSRSINGSKNGFLVLDLWWCLLWVLKPEWVLPHSHCRGECNVHSLRSMSGATLADLLTASITAGHFPTCISRGGSWLGFEQVTPAQKTNVIPLCQRPGCFDKSYFAESCPSGSAHGESVDQNHGRVVPVRGSPLRVTPLEIPYPASLIFQLV